MPVDSIMHFEDWLPDTRDALIEGPAPSRMDIALHLDPDPLWVPPVLPKSAIAQQPVLGLVWHRAYEVLHQAQELVFIGYSFPTTDIAARTLFEEALEDLPPPSITVVTLAADQGVRETIVTTYCSSFGEIPDARFHFDGATVRIRDYTDSRGQLD